MEKNAKNEHKKRKIDFFYFIVLVYPKCLHPRSHLRPHLRPTNTNTPRPKTCAWQ